MRILLSIIFSLFWTSAFAQAASTSRIQNKQYDKMLHLLLKHSVPEISCDELSYHYNDYIILDTREQVEYQVSHLPNAIHVGYDDFNNEAIKHISKKSKVVCYCSVGYRSEKIAKKLINLGYEHVWNLYGSSFEWANRNYVLVNQHQDTVHQIHAYNKLWSKWMNNPIIQKIY